MKPGISKAFKRFEFLCWRFFSSIIYFSRFLEDRNQLIENTSNISFQWKTKKPPFEGMIAKCSGIFVAMLRVLIFYALKFNMQQYPRIFFSMSIKIASNESHDNRWNFYAGHAYMKSERGLLSREPYYITSLYTFNLIFVVMPLIHSRIWIFHFI